MPLVRMYHLQHPSHAFTPDLLEYTCLKHQLMSI